MKTSKWKKFAKGYTQISLKKFLQLKNLKITVPRKYVINDLNNGEEIIEVFYEKELPKSNQEEFNIKKR